MQSFFDISHRFLTEKLIPCQSISFSTICCPWFLFMEILGVAVLSVIIVKVVTLLSIDVLHVAISFVSFALLDINEDAGPRLIV